MSASRARWMCSTGQTHRTKSSPARLLWLNSAACSRRRRARQIDLPLERVALAKFDRDVQVRWRIQQDAVSLFSEARQLIDLIPELPLRALDTLHLAYARHYGATSFATADKNQAEAARALGIPVAVFY